MAVCLVLAGLVLMAAFGGASSSATTSYGASGQTQLAGATPSPAGAYGDYGSTGASPAAANGKSGGQLAVRVDDQLGPVMTDGQGFTLYRFDKDTAKPPASNCSGAARPPGRPSSTTPVPRRAPGSIRASSARSPGPTARTS
ncbi:hypothetical protein GCM10025734_11890 [Kitasatospora paranensis]